MKITPYVGVELDLLRGYLSTRHAVGADSTAIMVALAIALGQLAASVSDADGLIQTAGELQRIVQANVLAKMPVAGSS